MILVVNITLKLKMIQEAGRRLGRPLFCVLSLILSVLVISACQGEKVAQVSVNGQTMGTTYTVKIVSQKSLLPDPTALKAKLDKRLVALNQSMSTYIDDSEISSINREKKGAVVGVWFKVSQPLFDVLSLSQSVSVLTEGAFDITVGPLVNLWGFGAGGVHETVPSETTLEVQKALIGYESLELDTDRGMLLKHKPISLDVSAVAKGYGVDVLAEYLQEQGYRNFMVEIGGELRLQGNSSHSRPWRIGVEAPRLVRGSPVAAVSVSEGGLATSGDYRNYFEKDGKRYSHTIDPLTGRPITHNLASVTVISQTAAQADALATAFLVMGFEKSAALAKKEKIAAFFIYREDGEMKTQYSQAFEPYIIQ